MSRAFELLARDEFNDVFDVSFRPKNWFMWPHLSAEVSLSDATKLFGIPAVFDPPDEDFPGPVGRWYVRIEDSIFTVTCARSHSMMRIDTTNSVCSPTGYDENRWSILKPLLRLPKELFRNTHWVRALDETGVWVVGKYGEGEPEIYRTNSEIDAIEFAEFLRDSGLQPGCTAHFKPPQAGSLKRGAKRGQT